MEDIPSKLNEDNLEQFLHEDNAFVDYFNTYLSLPCFPERIFYNKEDDIFEQFTQQLVKDESDNVQMKYNTLHTHVQISYCVTVLDRGKTLAWLNKYRLTEFIKSGLYAEYKLSKTLSSAQTIYIDTIKNDFSRATKSTDENWASSNDDDSFSNGSCISDVFEEYKEREAEFEAIINNEIESSSPKTYLKSHQERTEVPSIVLESPRECYPSIIVNAVEDNSNLTATVEEEVRNDVTRQVALYDDVTHVKEDVVSGDDVMDDRTKNVDVAKNDDIINSALDSDIISDDVRHVSVINRNNGDGSCVLASNQSLGSSESDISQDDLKNERLPFEDTQLLTKDKQLDRKKDTCNIEHGIGDSTTFYNEGCSNNVSDAIASDKQNERKGAAGGCNCLQKNDKVNELHGDKDCNVDIEESMHSSDFSRTISQSKENSDFISSKNLSSAIIHDITKDTQLIEDGKLLEDKNLDSNVEISTSTSNTVFSSSNQTDGLKTLSECDSYAFNSLEIKPSHTENVAQETLLKGSDDTNADMDENWLSSDDKGFVSTDNSGTVPLDFNVSKIEERTDENFPSTEIVDTSKSPQMSHFIDVSKLNSSPEKPSNIQGQNSYNSDTNIHEEIAAQKSETAGTIENLQSLYDVRTLKVDNPPAINVFSDRSFIKRTSSLYSFTSSDISIDGPESRSYVSEEEKEDILNHEIDLSSKAGMDKFKEFLINTRGEALLWFWLQVETLKCISNKGDKTRLFQEMKEQFLRNGSPLELPDELKKRAKKYFTNDLSETQRIIGEPLRCYWCPRFTLHQFKTKATERHEERFEHNTWSPVIQPKSDILMYPSTSPHLIRPHSCTPRGSLHETSPRETLHASSPQTSVDVKEGKHHVRSKSARGRIVTTPVHTNAGKKQLQIFAAPQPAEFGFQKQPVNEFPVCNDRDYFSSVRLVINPRRKPQSRTAWQQRQGENKICDSIKSLADEMDKESSLVDSLTYHNESGRFFKDFISKQKNRLWSNCLSFWQALMDYNALFEGENLNPLTVSKKAKWIYARYITSGCVCDIKLEWETQEYIRQKLDPPYEELFDCVEDHVLACLKEPWDSLCRNELREYDLIPKKETVRYLEVKLKRTRGRSATSFLQEELESQDGRDQSERGKYSIEEANNPQPMSSDGLSFESVIKDRDELEGFQKYLEKKDPKGVMDLMAWTEMETFQRIPRTIEDKRNKKAKEIRQGYLNSRYFFGPDSPATREAQNLILSMNGSPRIKERPSSSVISECQKYVRCRIERRWLALYKASQEYKERKNPTHNVSDVVEDIMLRRRLQRSEAAWRVLNSRWVSSSRDIVALRQTLNNPESCEAFRKFVALKGDTYENDVLFWIEIQKYKDLCHRHASEQCIKKKIQAITECFITSAIPPELQVDVPIEMAEKLMERITSRNQNIGPYLFREVQMTVFRILFNMWKDFCNFRSSVSDENLLRVLDKRLLQHRAEVKAKKEANEKKKLAKQEAEKKKKEKEEKDKKELRSMEQLMSLMTENSNWEQEENEVMIWKYSKHISSTSDHPSSREKKISAQDDDTSFMELTNQRSVATKSTNQITSSLRSNKHEKVRKSKRVSSQLTPSTYSAHSLKGTNSTTSRIPKINQSSHSSRSRDIKRYDVIERNGSEKVASGDDSQKQKVGKNKLLKNRERKKTKNVLDQEMFESVSNVGKEPLSTEIPDKQNRVMSPTTKEPGLKSHGRNSPKIEHGVDKSSVTERPGSLRTNVLRSQWYQGHGKHQSPVPLTSQLLKDFTNSPEGAPLETPLSLTRINISDDVSIVQSSEPHRKSPPTSASKTVKDANFVHWRTKRTFRTNEIEQTLPDVIVT